MSTIEEIDGAARLYKVEPEPEEILTPSGAVQKAKSHVMEETKLDYHSIIGRYAEEGDGHHYVFVATP